MHTPTNYNALNPLPNDDDTLISAAKAPTIIGAAKQSLARWRHEGVGPLYIKIGSRVFYRAGDLRAWIKTRTRQNTTAA